MRTRGDRGHVAGRNRYWPQRAATVTADFYLANSCRWYPDVGYGRAEFAPIAGELFGQGFRSFNKFCRWTALPQQ